MLYLIKSKMGKMGKIYVIVLDGAADRKVKALGGRTPLEYASLPCLDSLAREGQQSMIEILPGGLRDYGAAGLSSHEIL